MQFGSRINGRLVNLPATLGLTKPGDIYEVYVDTQGIPDETAAIQQLLTLEQNIQDLKVLYLKTDMATGRIILQFMDVGPGQFGFETVMAWLPQLLLISGVVVVGLVIFGLIPTLQTLPSWIWYIAVVGGLLVGGAWLIGALKITPPATTVQAYAQHKSTLAQKEKELKKAREEDIKKAEDIREAEQKVSKQREKVADLYASLESNIANEHRCWAAYQKNPTKTKEQACYNAAAKQEVLERKLVDEKALFQDLLGAAGVTPRTKADDLKIEDLQTRIERRRILLEKAKAKS